MKAKSILAALATMLTLGAPATLYQYQFNNVNAPIPDGNLTGWSAFINLAGQGMAPQIAGVSVKLDITGGYNGDIYAYLSFANVLVPLLKRVGVGSSDAFGSGDSGFNVALSSTGSDVHWASAGGGQLIGNYQVDGRTIGPSSPAGDFDSASRANFGAYQNLNPNGVWTLFIADVSGGGGQSVLNSWELDITAVPEPVHAALGCFAGMFLLVSICRSERVRKLFTA